MCAGGRREATTTPILHREATPVPPAETGVGQSDGLIRTSGGAAVLVGQRVNDSLTAVAYTARSPAVLEGVPCSGQWEKRRSNPVV